MLATSPAEYGKNESFAISTTCGIDGVGTLGVA
jgi:hypothetical protein